MADGIEVISHVEEIENAAKKQILQALEVCGGVVEARAVAIAEQKHIVDTGFLVNSITHCVAGESFSKSSYSAGGKSGSYSGTIGSKSEDAVYIGSNVYYAPYQELGTSKIPARPFLKPAMEESQEQIKKALEQYLKG